MMYLVILDMEGVFMTVVICLFLGFDGSGRASTSPRHQHHEESRW